MEFDKIIKENEKQIIQHLEKGGYEISKQKDLQRTPEWFEQRRGKFTGSGLNKLMKTSRATSRMEWGRAEKLVDFGQVAIKYIFEKAMERKTGKIIKIPSSASMRYGTENEQAAVEQMIKQKPDYEHTEVGFKEFLKDIAGASPDGYIIDKQTGEVHAYEGKCVTNWGTYFDRIKKIDEKHQDFWQVQAEMLSLAMESCIYSVAEPSESIFEANITAVNLQTVKASKTHQKALIDRCIIADKVIKLFLKSDLEIEDCIKKVI